MKQTFFFFHRSGDNPGITVSKNDTIPGGDFGITEYVFQQCGYASLWFVDLDDFTEKERDLAYQQFLGGATKPALH